MAMLTTLFSLAIGAATPTTTTSSVIDPGSGVAPPGSDKLLLLVQYGAYLTFAACVAGALYAAAKLALTQDGRNSQHQTHLVWVLAAAIIAGSASALVGALA